LTEEETRTLFSKLAQYIGRNINYLIDRKDEPHCFRLLSYKCFYIREALVKVSSSIPRKHLHAIGICLGHFTKAGKFRLSITALPLLAQQAVFKTWVKPNGEMPYLYGNHVLKAHVDRMTEDCAENQGVIVYSTNDIPLGFGVTARASVETRKLDPTTIIVLHQSDIGEYLRDENL